MYIIEEGNLTTNDKAYLEIIKDYPHMGYILTNMYVSTYYTLYNIKEAQDKIIFYFNKHSIIDLKNDEICNLCLKYKLDLQVPDNQKYSFRISINKVETI